MKSLLAGVAMIALLYPALAYTDESDESPPGKYCVLYSTVKQLHDELAAAIEKAKRESPGHFSLVEVMASFLRTNLDMYIEGLEVVETEDDCAALGLKMVPETEDADEDDETN